MEKGHAVVDTFFSVLIGREWEHRGQRNSKATSAWKYHVIQHESKSRHPATVF